MGFEWRSSICNVIAILSCRNRELQRGVNNRICVRECEYLEYLKSRDVAFYGEVVEVLRDSRGGEKPPSAPPAGGSGEIYPCLKSMENED